MILSKFPIKFKKFVPYNRFFNSAIGEAFARKGFLEVIVETPKGDLRIVNTHLHEETPFFDQSVRLVQLKKMLSKVEGGNLPTLMTGDFNQHSLMHQKEFSGLLDYFGFSHPFHGNEHLPSYRPENIYVDNWINRTKIPKRFDYILVKGLDNLSLRTIYYEPQHLSPELSDHDPILLLLSGIQSAK